MAGTKAPSGAPRASAAMSGIGAGLALAGAGRGLVPFGLFLFAWLVGNLAQAAVGSLYPLLMRSDFGLPPSTSSYALAAVTAASAFLSLPASERVPTLLHLNPGVRGVLVVWGDPVWDGPAGEDG